MTALKGEHAQAACPAHLVQWNMHLEPGGHYAAHLEPDVLADDIRAFYAGRR